MEPGKVDILRLFGRETINIRDVFLSAPDSKHFLRAYAFNENKSIKQTTTSGHKKVWVCKSELCHWAVCLTKRHSTQNKDGKARQRTHTKNAFCPPGAWFVSEINLQHSPSCDSVGQCSGDLLRELPGFKGSIVQGLSTARARVAAAVKIIDNVNVDHRPALVHRAIAKAKSKSASASDGYDKLPSFLRSFERQNPGSRVCCQLDSNGRFFRAFLTLGSLVAAQDNWVPLLECDGTHMKHESYNGVCILLVGKDGDWKNIPVAVAFVHKETAETFEWVFANCVVAGIKLHDRPVFSDRGKQREAQVRLRARGVPVHLKFCAWHIYFNVCGHFRSVEPTIENIKGLVFRLQATTTLNDFERVLSDIQVSYPSPRTVKGNGSLQRQTVAEYLRAIHPASWTKFGNGPVTPEESDAVATEWESAKSYGDGLPLFAGRTTSAVEGQNNALLLSGIRDSQVLGALVLFCNSLVVTIAEKKQSARDWVKAKHTVTPRAKSMFDKQVWAAAACTVRKSTEDIFHVDDSVTSLDEDNSTSEGSVAAVAASVETTPQTYTVDLQTGICTRCADRHHLQLPCRHIIAATFNQSGCRTSTAGVYKFFHASYTVQAYNEAFQHVSISLPFVPALLSDTNIRPPPLYNQAGGTSHATRRDVATREKRIPSVGEPKRSKPKRDPKKNPSSGIDQAVLASEMQEYFSEEIRAHQKQKRRKYRCGRCGKVEGHNAAKCPNRSAGNTEHDVHPGIYVVGACPIEILRQRSAFISVQVENPTILSEFSF